MVKNQKINRNDKTWFRKFLQANGITTEKQMAEIFPNTPTGTLHGLWIGRHAATGAYADALLWYAKAKRKNWEWLVNTDN